MIMAQIREVQRVKSVCGITFAQSVELEGILDAIAGIIGKVEQRCEVFEFDHTGYYAEEMGDGLRKVFASFQGLIHPGRLSEMKKKTTNELEAVWSEHERRKVNLDPGYVTMAKVVMASAKDFAHRVYIGDGIYGDVQLQYRDHGFRVQPWTFPDYQTQIALSFFEDVRKALYEEVKTHG